MERNRDFFLFLFLFYNDRRGGREKSKSERRRRRMNSWKRGSRDNAVKRSCCSDWRPTTKAFVRFRGESYVVEAGIGQSPRCKRLYRANAIHGPIKRVSARVICRLHFFPEPTNLSANGAAIRFFIKSRGKRLTDFLLNDSTLTNLALFLSSRPENRSSNSFRGVIRKNGDLGIDIEAVDFVDINACE